MLHKDILADAKSIVSGKKAEHDKAIGVNFSDMATNPNAAKRLTKLFWAVQMEMQEGKRVLDVNGLPEQFDRNVNAVRVDPTIKYWKAAESAGFVFSVQKATQDESKLILQD